MTLDIKSLQQEQTDLMHRLAKVKAGIDALQAICKHSWHYDGHDHKDDLYVCSECGAQEWR